MQKCTLSRIKSYEEKHDIKSLIIRQNSSNDYELLYNINNNNNKIEINLKQLSANDKKSNLIKANSQINTSRTHFIKNNEKLINEGKKNKKIALKNIPNNFSEPKNILFRRQKTYFIQKKNIRLQSKNIQKHLVSTGNTSGEIDINDNEDEDINEFNSEENNFTINGHISNLTSIFCFPQYFGSKKSINEKESNINKNIKKKEKTKMKVREKCRKNKDYFGNNYSTNDSLNNNKCIQKLNFDQPNKNINVTKNDKCHKKIINGINNKNKNENGNNKISSCNNVDKVNSIIKNLVNKSDIIRKKNSYSNNCYLHKINKDKININNNSKKKLSNNDKNIISNPSKQITINKIFQRTENQNKNTKNCINNKNIPNLFIKNSIMNKNKKSLTKYDDKSQNENSIKTVINKLGSSQNINKKQLSMKRLLKTSIKKTLNTNSEENKEIYEFHYKSSKKKLINSNNIKNNKKINDKTNIIKKNSTQMKNISCTKRIIKRVNKTKMIENPNENQVINLIYSKKECNLKNNKNLYKNNNTLNNNIFNNINLLKGKKQIKDTNIINNNITYSTNSNSDFFYFDDDSQSDTDKEENSIKKNYLSNINKNFNNAKKVLNKTINYKENGINFIIPKKINSCNNNKNYISNKTIKNKINLKIVIKIFNNNNIGKYLDKKSWLNLSLLNKKFYKKQRILIFQTYFNKIIRDQNCDKNKINLLKKIFIYSSEELKINNKSDIIKKYNYYSKKIKSNYKEDILKDISRTFPNDINFNEKIKQKLYNLLICYSNFNKNIGYAQGLNFIAASCLYYFKNEEDAFVFLDSFINRLELNNLLGFNNDILIQKIKYLDLLLNKYIPDLNKYLNSKLLNHEFFTTGWIISIFSNKMDKQKLLICWCFMVIFGWKFFYSFIIQLLIMYKDTIIKTEQSKLCFKMKNILIDNQFIKDFNYIIKNTLFFMVDNIIL